MRKKLVATFYACFFIAVISHLVGFLYFTEGNIDGALTAEWIALVFDVLGILAVSLRRLFPK